MDHHENFSFDIPSVERSAVPTSKFVAPYEAVGSPVRPIDVILKHGHTERIIQVFGNNSSPGWNIKSQISL